MGEFPGIQGRWRKLYMRLKVQGRWVWIRSSYEVGQEAEAARERAQAQERIDAGEEFASAAGGPPTVRAYAERKFLPRRREFGVRSVADDESRLKTWVYPSIGDMLLKDVRPRHIETVTRAARTAQCAPRTVRNIYTVMRSLFREAEIAGLIGLGMNPCILTQHQLGKIRDGKREWRAGAIYERAELEALISDARVPWDRRVLYGLLGLAGLRHGEAAALRWRHIVTGLDPLGRIVVANSNDRDTTKTDTERWTPLHPVLAAMLAEWKLGGWPREFDRKPGPDDLIVPHTKPTNRGPRVEFGGMRSDHDTYKRMRLDRAALGQRSRRVHDLRRTFITLCQEDGADPQKLRLVTHGAPGHDVIALYTSLGWATLCKQVSCLKIERRTKKADTETSSA